MKTKATVLTVDDDENLQTVMRHYLEQEGYRILSATSGKELLEKLDGAHPDIILLDLILPDNDGLTLLSLIRHKTKAAVIVVSGKDETADRIVGLEMGADDYMTKPFEMRELSARIKAVLRRTAGGPQDAAGAIASQKEKDAQAQRLAFGAWMLDRGRYQVTNDSGESADLTSGEFKLLEALLMSPNRVLTREHLFELTRQGDFEAYDRAIDIQVARIRKKINDNPKSPELIKTVRGVGYMFCGSVRAAD